MRWRYHAPALRTGQQIGPAFVVRLERLGFVTLDNPRGLALAVRLPGAALGVLTGHSGAVAAISAHLGTAAVISAHRGAALPTGARSGSVGTSGVRTGTVVES
jgi:hypothetical protein